MDDSPTAPMLLQLKAVEGTTTPIRTADSRAGYRANCTEIDAAIRAACEQPHYALGPLSSNFEYEFPGDGDSSHRADARASR